MLFQRQGFDRTGAEFPAPARPPIRLGEYRQDIALCFNQGLEMNGGKLGGAGKDYFHEWLSFIAPIRQGLSSFNNKQVANNTHIL